MKREVASIDVVVDGGFPAQIIGSCRKEGVDYVRICYSTGATGFDSSTFKETVVPVAVLQGSGLVPQIGGRFLYFPASAKVSGDIPPHMQRWYAAIHSWMDSD